MRTIVATIVLLLASQLPAHAHHEEAVSFPQVTVVVGGIGLIAVFLVITAIRASLVKDHSS